MSSPDLSRVSQLIPHVSSTLASYHSVLQSGAELRESSAIEYQGDLEELLVTLNTVIEHCLENGQLDRLEEQFLLHERLSLVLADQKLQLESFLERGEEETESESEESAVLAVDTKEIIELIHNEEGEINTPVEDFTCSICFEETEKEDGYLFADCFHVFCKECVEGYLNNAIMCGDVVNISCPDASCEAPVLVQDIQKVVTAEKFQKFENFSMLAFLRTNPHTRWCPHVPCEGVFIGEDYTKGIVNCPTCSRNICFDCSSVAHEGMNCTEYKKSTEKDDKKTEKWKKKHNVKQCPHCGLDTIRISGCPDIICLGCKQHWDWFADEPDEWGGDGLWRTSETKLETAAFIYPRLVKLVAGSRDVDTPEEERQTMAILAVFGIAGVPLTVVCGGPALAVRSGRSLKNKIKSKFSSESKKE